MLPTFYHRERTLSALLVRDVTQTPVAPVPDQSHITSMQETSSRTTTGVVRHGWTRRIGATNRARLDSIQVRAITLVVPGHFNRLFC